MIRQIVWWILYGITCLVIWYLVWVCDNDREAKDIAYEALQDYCRMLEKDNKNMLRYLPKAERCKDMILLMHRMWKTDIEIWKAVWLNNSSIGKALRRWGIKGVK